MLAQIVLFDGFDPLDALLPYEVLSAGGFLSGGMVEAELVSAEGHAKYRADSSRSSCRRQPHWSRHALT
jgi:putative intracellular protease/amidase